MQIYAILLLIQAHLPRLDAGLRYALRGYCAFALAVALLNIDPASVRRAKTRLYKKLATTAAPAAAQAPAQRELAEPAAAE